MATFQAKVFERVSSRAFNNAKKLADLAIRESFVNGKPTTIGYQKAISFLEQFQYSTKESESLDAQRLVQGYTNDFNKIQSRDSSRRKSVNEIKLEEKNAYYQDALRGGDAFILTNDIMGMLGEQVDILNRKLFDVSDTIDFQESEGSDVSNLITQRDEMVRRYQDISDLHERLLDGDISRLGEFKLFLDNSRSGVDGVFIAKENDLPPELKDRSYTYINETAEIAGIPGAFIGVNAEFYHDSMDNRFKVDIGNRQWKRFGTTGNFVYDTKSDPTYISNPKKGSFSLAGLSINNNPTGTPGSYFTGYTGYDEKGDYVKTLFRTSPDGRQVYSIDEKDIERLKSDPIEAAGIERAMKRNPLNPQYIKEQVTPNAVPINFTPFNPPQVPSASSSVPTSQPTEPTEFFGGRTNRPNKPDESIVGLSVPDIVEEGKSFFRTNPLTKPFVEGFFGKK